MEHISEFFVRRPFLAGSRVISEEEYQLLLNRALRLSPRRMRMILSYMVGWQDCKGGGSFGPSETQVARINDQWAAAQ